MIEHLAVSNLGLIESADIAPTRGFTVITGETGAGKTLLLGGLRLLLGGDASEAVVGSARDEARAEGLFVIDGDEIGVARVVPREGRSRAYVDGSIASVSALADRIGARLQVVGQHEQLNLMSPRTALESLDAVMTKSEETARAVYTKAWERLTLARERLAALGDDPAALVRELDLVKHQASEIAQAGLTPGLDLELEAQLRTSRNAKAITEALNDAARVSDGLRERAGELLAIARRLGDLEADPTVIRELSDTLFATAEEVPGEIDALLERIDLDPDRLAEIEQSLNLIGDLKRKYGRSIEDIISFGKDAERRADELSELLGGAEGLEADVARAEGEVGAAAKDLTLARQEAGKRLGQLASTHLADVGMPTGRLEVALHATDPGPSGADRAELLFSSSSGLDPAPIARAASGGELSRLVLAVSLAVRKPASDTLVFDEVDAGIGGMTAVAMGEKLADLGRTTQVLCVTHLAQVAAHADRHYVVERSDDVATVRLVADETRVDEIARMLGAGTESEAGRSAAAEMIATASNDGQSPT